MNTTTMRTMMAAAALVVAAGSASAQTYKADVPVAFKVGSKTMAAGSYDIRLTIGVSEPMVVVRNSETHSAAALVPGSRGDAPKSWQEAGTPRIAFECIGDSCTLRTLWNGSDIFAYQFAAPKPPARDLAAARNEVITLALIKVR